jgi:hypothetical protein
LGHPVSTLSQLLQQKFHFSSAKELEQIIAFGNKDLVPACNFSRPQLMKL